MLTEIDKQIGMRSLAVLLVCIVIAIVVGNYTQKGRNKRIANLECNGLYTLGKVTSYTTSTSVGIGNGSPQTVNFTYSVKNKLYETNYNDRDYPVPKENGPEEGAEFMAIYLPNEPEKCALLFDYPVKDSLDYKHYIEEFKTKRPLLGN